MSGITEECDSLPRGNVWRRKFGVEGRCFSEGKPSLGAIEKRRPRDQIPTILALLTCAEAVLFLC